MNEEKRRENNKERVLTVLQQKGRQGVTNSELIGIGGYRYGARLFELRREGWDIETKPAGEGLFRFVLKGRIEAKQESLFAN